MFSFDDGHGQGAKKFLNFGVTPTHIASLHIFLLVSWSYNVRGVELEWSGVFGCTNEEVNGTIQMVSNKKRRKGKGRTAIQRVICMDDGPVSGSAATWG